MSEKKQQKVALRDTLEAIRIVFGRVLRGKSPHSKIGIPMPLGASRRDVVKLIHRQGMRPVVALHYEMRSFDLIS